MRQSTVLSLLFTLCGLLLKYIHGDILLPNCGAYTIPDNQVCLIHSVHTCNTFPNILFIDVFYLRLFISQIISQITVLVGALFSHLELTQHLMGVDIQLCYLSCR